MNKVIILTGGIVTVAYVTEYFIGWYSGISYENYTYLSFGAATGPYAWAFWALITCNFIVPLTLWVKKLRRNIFWTFIVALVINIGMWFERFDIIVLCLSKGRTPSSWAMFSPTFIDIGTFVGTIGFFFVLFLLYARTFPVIAQAEVKSILKSSGDKYKRLREEHGDDHHIGEIEQYPASGGPSANIEGNKSEEDLDSFGSTNKNDEDEIENALLDTEEKRIAAERLIDKVGEFDPEKQSEDNLEKINGLGPITVQQLHELGIFTYHQVSKMTMKEYNDLDLIIETFSASVAKEKDFAGQAQKLKNN